MAWRLNSRNVQVVEKWNRLRGSRRVTLRKAFEAIDAAGCSNAPNVYQHPRSTNLFVSIVGRYLIAFECHPNTVVVSSISGIPGAKRNLTAVELAG